MDIELMPGRVVASPHGWVKAAQPYGVALASLALTWLVLRPNLWLGLQGDGAFYQSLSENGRLPLEAEQDLAYFPQRLSLLVPERLVNLVVGDQEGYVVARLLMAAFLTVFAVASVPAPLRFRASAWIGVVAATTPPAIGWLSQNYPTAMTGLAIAGGAVASCMLFTASSRRSVLLLGVVLGAVAAALVFGHWGSAYFGLPVFVAAALALLRSPARSHFWSAAAGALAGGSIAALLMSALGLAFFGVGTPQQLWAMNMRGMELVEAALTTYGGYEPWSWVWWQTTLALWGMAIVMPIVLRLRTGSWQQHSLTLSGVLGGALLLGALLNPLALGNTQSNLQVWPLALLALAHGIGMIAATSGAGPTRGESRQSLAWAAVAVFGAAGVAWLGVQAARPSGLGLTAAALVSAAAMGIAASARVWPESWRMSGFGVVEPVASAAILVAVVFFVSSSQSVPVGVVNQGPSPDYPQLPPFAWIDYSQSFGESPAGEARARSYAAAAVVSDAAYANCPEGAKVTYWPSATADAYLTWGIFAPYNSATTTFPVVPETAEELCLVAIATAGAFDQLPSPDVDRARLLGEVDVRQGAGNPDVESVVRTYLVEPGP